MDHSSTIKALGGGKVVADALRARGHIVADVTVRSWSHKDRIIPPKYWVDVVAIAADANVPGVTFEALAQAAAAVPVVLVAGRGAAAMPRASTMGDDRGALHAVGGTR